MNNERELAYDETLDKALEGCASYEDGDRHVICDRKNPNAWVRSDTAYPLDEETLDGLL